MKVVFIGSFVLNTLIIVKWSPHTRLITDLKAIKMASS